jgi:hypothetical protein
MISIIINVYFFIVFFVKTYKIALENNLKNKAGTLAKELTDSRGHVLFVNQQETLHYLVEMAEDDVISVQIYNRDSVEIVRSKK